MRPVTQGIPCSNVFLLISDILKGEVLVVSQRTWILQQQQHLIYAEAL